MSLPTGAHDSQPAERPGALTRLFLIIAAAVVPYLLTASTTFLSDDSFYVRIYSKRGLRDLPALFHADWSYGLWGYPLAEIRPIAAASFMFDWRFWAANPFGYHLTNIALHAICAVLIAVIAQRAARIDANTATFSGILFALQPAHVGAVSWITGRVDLIAALFFLGAFVTYAAWRNSHRIRWVCFSLLFFVAALFSKEIAITLPVVLFAFELTVNRARLTEALKRVSCYFGVLVGYLILRTVTLGSITGPQYFLSDSAGYVFFKSQPKALVSLFPPFDLLLLAMRGRWAFAILAVVVIAGIVIARRGSGIRGTVANSRSSLLFFGILWYAITALPMLTTNEEMRRYYLPSAGICVATAIVISMVRPMRARAVASAALVLLSVISLVINLTDFANVAAAAYDAHTSLQAAAGSTNGRSLVVTALPASYHAVPLWSTTNPVAYQPPFAAVDLTQKLIVVESPSAYVTDSAWHRAYSGLVTHDIPISGNRCAIIFFEPRVERAITTPVGCSAVLSMIDAFISREPVPVPDDYYGAYTRSWNNYWTGIARDLEPANRFPLRNSTRER